MNNEYRDFGYSSATPANDQAGHKLAMLFVSLIRGIHGIDSICDLGSGNGYLAGQLGACGYKVTGIDASKSGIEIATRHFSSNRVQFVLSKIDPDIAQSVVAGQSFDAVVSSDVIEHLYRPSTLVETAVKLLKPGGYFVIGTPYHGYLKNLAISLLGKWDSHHTTNWEGGHIQFFSARTLRTLVKGHGFEDPQFYFYGRLPFLWKNMVCVTRRGN